MSFQRLCKLLRRGVEPDRLPRAKALEGGGSRTAFKVGRYVVKSAEHWGIRQGQSPVGKLQRLGLHPPKQWRIGPWLVQWYYRPLTWDQYYKHPLWPRWEETQLDIHAFNVGWDDRGRVVAFDW